MKINILTDRKPVELEMNLFLEKSVSLPNTVSLKGMDARGTVWYLANIDEKGIELTINIGEETGWPLDKDGRLKLLNYFASAEDYE